MVGEAVSYHTVNVRTRFSGIFIIIIQYLSIFVVLIKHLLYIYVVIFILPWKKLLNCRS